ncbi:MAG: guanylate kinase [Candidatus Pacebacteria bacterium]|nr:guanylate kinase [Candidatus Paceibacterota bacterium]MBP9058368.1 guanylate kinase [Candidatus Paceibacterota bacterium]MBP9770074.1 guanylate kinase [Candidatus Paceibacterota bacterium]
MKKKALILSAPSGAGKTTLAHMLKDENPEFVFTISATTREIREGETDGVNYYFLSVEEFKIKIEAGEFFEWEEVYPGKFYGTLWSEIDRINKNDQIPLLDIDIKGGLTFKEKMGDDAVLVFVSVPEPKMDILRERLFKRSQTTFEPIVDMKIRLQKASQEFDLMDKADYILVNQELESTYQDLKNLVEIEFPDDIIF